jgi:hypothetical protein
MEKNFLQKIKPNLSLGAHVVLRSYLRVPDCDCHGFEDVTANFTDIIRLEKTQMYKVKVLKKIEV